MRCLKRILIGAVLVIAIALTVTSCETVMSILNRTDQTQNFYLAAKQIYDEARANEREFTSHVMWKSEASDTEAHIDLQIAKDALRYDYNDSLLGTLEYITFIDGRMYFTGDNGCGYYDTTKQDVLDYVENTSAMRLIEPLYTCDFPASWFDGVEVTDNGDGGYLLVNISSDMAAQHSHPEMFAEGATCEVYFNSDGSFSLIRLTDIIIKRTRCNVDISFIWDSIHGIELPSGADVYKYYGRYTYGSGIVLGEDTQSECEHPANMITEEKVEPTCTTSGYVKHVCECGEIIGETVLGPTGHNIVQLGERASTCTEQGWAWSERCTKCDYEMKHMLPLADHDYLYGYCAFCGEAEPYSLDVLSFTSNGDGTCYVSYCSERNRVRDIIIPPVSPDGETVTGIGQYAFNSNTFIRSVLIPDTVVTIKGGAFFGTYSLKRVYIGAGVAEIEEGVFAQCENLYSIEVDDDNPYFKDVDGHLYSKDGKTFLRYAKARTEETYTVLDGVEYVHLGAFKECDNLKKVTLPSTLKSLAIYLFDSCDNLEHVNIPDGITELPDGSFNNCIYLREITIPSSVKTIGDSVFLGCHSLRSVVIPYGVETIGWNAFFGCGGLTEIIIPDSVTSIGRYAFAHCSSLGFVKMSENMTVIPVEAFTCTALTTVIIPSNVVTVDDKAFERCYKLHTVVISASVEVIGEAVFNECTSLKYVFTERSFGEAEHGALNTPLYSAEYYAYSEAMPDGAKYWHYVNGVPVIWDVYYNGAGYSAGLTYVSNGDGTCYVSGKGSFSGTVLIIPATSPSGDRVTAIGASAFEGLTSINTVIIPGSVTAIGERAFIGCTSLLRVDIPDSVQTVGAGAFKGCTSLVSVRLGLGITGIADYTFDGCESLVSVFYGNGVSSIGDYAFRGCGMYYSIIGNGVQTIGNHAFEGCVSYMIIIGERVVSIGDFAFADCTGVAILSIPKATESIGYGAFKNCEHIQTLKVDKDNPSYMSKSTAIYTKDGKTLILCATPDGINYDEAFLGVEHISDYAVSGARIHYVCLTNELVSIGDYAFLDVQMLTTVYFYGTEAEWREVTVGEGNEALTNATVYFYSETEPTEEGNYWHYDSNGHFAFW